MSKLEKAKTDSTARDERERLMKQVEELESKMPEPLPAVHTVTAQPDRRTPIHLLARGDYQHKGDRVGMRALGVLLPDDAPELPETTARPRLELARWIASPANPLTARVMVNRIWHYHFGRGLVGTPNDFGRMGERPSHPELLDYLANELVAAGWSVNRIHRLILNSNTYRQSSTLPQNAALRAKALETDPQNKLIWRFNRRRLEAEEIRDAVLAISGNLNVKQGGPSVMVPIAKELVEALYKPSQWQVAAEPSEHARRSIYLINKRNLRLPMMEVFDAPDALVSCPRRESSTHAPQALELLNGEFTNRQAEILAARLEREAGAEPKAQVTLAYRLATGRPPSSRQMALALEFLKTQPRREFALAVLNLNAFLYVN